MRRLAGDERMLAGGQVQPLDDAEVREDVQRPEDRRPGHAEPPPARLAEQLVGREVAALRRR